MDDDGSATMPFLFTFESMHGENAGDAISLPPSSQIEVSLVDKMLVQESLAMLGNVLEGPQHVMLGGFDGAILEALEVSSTMSVTAAVSTTSSTSNSLLKGRSVPSSPKPFQDISALSSSQHTNAYNNSVYVTCPQAWPTSLHELPQLTAPQDQECMISVRKCTQLQRSRTKKLQPTHDMYSPKEVRGKGPLKEGRCPLCPEETWLKIKQSAYWYHMNFTHGISAVTGQPHPMPSSYRRLQSSPNTPNTHTTYTGIGLTDKEHQQPSLIAIEGCCPKCNQWITIHVLEWDDKQPRSISICTLNHASWYKHVQKCTQK